MTDNPRSEFNSHQTILSCLHSVSPSRSQELDDLIQELSVQFHLDVNAYRVNDFWAEFPSRKINIPRLCLFRLKAHAYSYLVVLNNILARREHRVVENLCQREHLVNELLTWATRTDVATTDQDGSEFSIGAVPNDLEDMLNNAAICKESGPAEEGFRHAVAWMIHHELAHIRLGHDDVVDPDIVAQEREADCTAIDWLLSDHTKEAELLASVYGITVGLGWLACLRVYLDEEDEQHGSACARFVEGLEYLTKKVDPEIAEFAWGIAQVILYLHAKNHRYLHGKNHQLTITPEDMQGSFCEIVKRLVAIIEASKVH